MTTGRISARSEPCLCIHSPRIVARICTAVIIKEMVRSGRSSTTATARSHEILGHAEDPGGPRAGARSGAGRHGRISSWGNSATRECDRSPQKSAIMIAGSGAATVTGAGRCRSWYIDTRPCFCGGTRNGATRSSPSPVLTRVSGWRRPATPTPPYTRRSTVAMACVSVRCMRVTLLNQRIAYLNINPGQRMGRTGKNATGPGYRLPGPVTTPRLRFGHRTSNNLRVSVVVPACKR